MAWYLDPENVAAEAAMAAAIKNFADVRHRLQAEDEEDPDEAGPLREQAYVTAWVVAYEYTTPNLEQTKRAGRQVASGSDQQLSAGRGLLDWGKEQF